MTRAPRLTGAEVIARLEKAGFSVARVRGSHYRVTHLDGRSTTVPVHGSEIIGPGLLSKILRDCELARKSFEELE